MQTIAHRELRNHSSDILARAQGGESFTITNHGKPVALLTPPQPQTTELERLRAAGRTLPARRAPGQRIADVIRTPGLRSRELLEDIRGNW